MALLSQGPSSGKSSVIFVFDQTRSKRENESFVRWPVERHDNEFADDANFYKSVVSIAAERENSRGVNRLPGEGSALCGGPAGVEILKEPCGCNG